MSIANTIETNSTVKTTAVFSKKQKRPLFVESRMGQQQKVACNNNDLSLICR